jgi:hypothetical protein
VTAVLRMDIDGAVALGALRVVVNCAGVSWGAGSSTELQAA